MLRTLLSYKGVIAVAKPSGDIRDYAGRTFVTVSECAAILHVSRPHVYAMIKADQMPVMHIGKVLRIPRAWIETQLQLSSVSSAV